MQTKELLRFLKYEKVEYKPLCEVCHSKHLGEKSASPCDSKLSPCHSERSEKSQQTNRDISGVALNMTKEVNCHSERSEESQNIESLKDSNKMFWRLICKQKNF
ncbi:hypothetical protein ACRE1U_08680 [Helicobacter himalayensis]|uniref:hypothetical protein n=1 Tax=Helicobacter himalayensis TaxID=1591088 RepID=UPI003D6DAD07